MTEIRVVRSSKEISGVDSPIGSEWDAGYVPFGAAFRRCRVTVRKDNENLWTVYTVGFLGDQKLASWSTFSFPCETCAKAFSLCLIFGDDYAECSTHGLDEIDEAELLIARVAILCCLMGIDKATYNKLSVGSQHRISWIARLISERKLEWGKVIRAWGATEQWASRKGVSLDSAISNFYTEVTFWR